MAKPPAATTAAAAPARRKGGPAREWLVVSSSGASWVEEAGRQPIMRRTGLPARDLRVLDPLLSYPSTILGRDGAIVVSIEHVKAIITAGEALVPNFRDPLVAPFVHDLQSRLSPSDAAAAGTKAAEVVGDDAASPTKSGGAAAEGAAPESGKMLAFEFRVLEVCLETACSILESETSLLEKEAYPALDELTSKVSTLNLERVRQIKSRLVAISGRVQKVRDELEHLLDDDMDMAAMYLSDKIIRPPPGVSGRHSLSGRHSIGNAALNSSDDDNDKERDDADEELSDEIQSNHGSFAFGLKPLISDLEMLLEAYFVQVDGTLNKLSTLREYVDDTEDYINIMLDDKQNQLLQMGVMLTTATLVMTCGIIVTGVLGMNIHVSIFDAPVVTFWHATGGLLASTVAAYIIVIAWGKRSGLLQW